LGKKSDTTPGDAALEKVRWYSQMGRRVWPFELRNFFFRDRRLGNGPTVAELWGAPQDAEEQSMAAAHPERQVALRKAA
jgi:anaerobic magnesium-protoporphyrin IX monomethyl ester cyclase